MNESIFTDYVFKNRLRSNDFLTSIDSMINWGSLVRLISCIHLRDTSNLGRNSYPRLTMLKALLLQQWYNLSDVELENSLRDRLSFIRFCNLPLEGSVPDHSTICRFRNKLIAQKLHSKILNEVNSQIGSYGISIKSGSVIDATLIKSYSRPNRKEYIEVEPTGDETNDSDIYKVTLEREESKDSDARWIKKGNKSVYGYKSNLSVDPETGLVQANITTPANVHDIKTLPGLLELLCLDKGCSVLADKGYSSNAVRSLIREMGYKAGIMFKKHKNDMLKKLKTRFNKKISKIRYIVEQTFGCLHSHYNLVRTPYVGIEKTDYFISMKCIAFNLKKAVKLCEF